MTDNMASVVVTVLIILVVVLTLRDSSLNRKIRLLTLQKFSLVDKMRELGVHVTEDKKTFSGLAYRYTEAASTLLKAHYYPSSWNLERQLDLEAYTAQIEAEAEDKARDKARDKAEIALLDAARLHAEERDTMLNMEDSVTLREALLGAREREAGIPPPPEPKPTPPPDLS